MLKLKVGRSLLRLFILVLLLSVPVSEFAENLDVKVVTPNSISVNGSAKNKVVGLVPSEVRGAYGFDQIVNQGAGQTIGIILAFDHPYLEQDLAVFNQMFNLPSCTISNGCLEKVYASGSLPVPAPSYPSWAVDLWMLEHALDAEWAHAIAPGARIMIVESDPDVNSLMHAVDVAVTMGANVVSMSWGTGEFSRQTTLDNHFVAANVSFVASAGDGGNPGVWPAASSNVTAVGGTALHIDAKGNYSNENSWNGGGGGLSVLETEPNYQSEFNIPNNPGGKRGIPDVAYDAAPNTGVAVYTSLPAASSGWQQVGGTSAGAPQWAALLAITNSMRTAAGKFPLQGSNPALYAAAKVSHGTRYNDIFAGTNTNGKCGTLCSAAPGYDYVTGLGSPRANNLVNALVNAP